MAGTLVLFWAFAGLALASALGCITRRSPVASALWLVVTLFALAALFVLLDAQFIAVLQLLVYAGAIMVLFLFVIMLLNLGHPGPMDVKGPVGVGTAFLLGGVLLFQLWILRGEEEEAVDVERADVRGEQRPGDPPRVPRAAAPPRHPAVQVRRRGAVRQESRARSPG